MAMAPRPLSADMTTVTAAGPKAKSVTMRRSKASALAATGGALSCAAGRAPPTPAAPSTAGDQQRRQQKRHLAEGEEDRMQDVIQQPARGRRARAGIGKGKKIVAHQPHEVRRHDEERDRERDPGASRRQRAARIAIEQQE